MMWRRSRVRAQVKGISTREVKSKGAVLHWLWQKGALDITWASADTEHVMPS